MLVRDIKLHLKEKAPTRVEPGMPGLGCPEIGRFTACDDGWEVGSCGCGGTAGVGTGADATESEFSSQIFGSV